MFHLSRSLPVIHLGPCWHNDHTTNYYEEMEVMDRIQSDSQPSKSTI